ncbi:MAG: Lrp/AsnC family transcriptional regulator [Eubacterium sp.]|nr:Lrp/AsnC family transcriptional regulator [Eubacterium sp.]
MDKTDYRILTILKENARESASSIGKKIHLSVSAVIERIRKMEESGIIRSYTIIVDEQKTGNTLTALMEVSLDNPRNLDGFAAHVAQMDCIVSCYYLTGEFDLLLKIVCASSDELEQIHRSIMSLEGVKETRTHVVLKHIKNSHSVIRRPEYPPDEGR